jgi:hypothetical protein
MRLPLALALAALLAAPAARAAPVVTVKAHTTLRVVGVYRGPTGLSLVGELQDRDFLTGVPNRTVEVTVVEHNLPVTRVVRTDDQGRFSIPISGDGTTVRVTARFGGDREYAPEWPGPQEVDVTKQNLDLDIEVGTELDAARPDQIVKLRARAGTAPAEGVVVSIRTDRGLSLAQVTSGKGGRATATVPTASLGGPGPSTLVFHFAGSEQLNATTVRYEIMLTTPVHVDLQADEMRVDADGEILLSGSVKDLRGPIHGATIGIEAMGRHAASALSDAAGRFRFKLPASDYPPGTLDLVARYTPAVIWRRPSASPVLQLAILAPRPIPLRDYFIPAFVTAFVIAVLALIRFGPALRARLLRGERQPTSSDKGTQPAASGVRLSRTSLRSLMRPSFDLSGQVWDPTDNCPVAGASIRIAGPDGQPLRAAEADGAGRFLVEGLPAGVVTVIVTRAGYVHEEFHAQLPHRGSLHNLRVDIVQVRVRLLELYQIAALPLLPDKALWGCWTPRELVRHSGAQLGRRPAPLVELTLLLEHAYWSGQPVEERILGRARDLVQ